MVILRMTAAEKRYFRVGRQVDIAVAASARSLRPDRSPDGADRGRGACAV